MPLGAFVGDSLAKDFLKKLMKTTRPFYRKSLELVLACRKIPQPVSNNATQIKEWNELLEGVESTLALGITALHAKDIDAANETYEYQYRQVNAYIQRYQGPKADQLKFEEVAKNDRVAGSLMMKVKAEVHTKMKELKSIPTLKLAISLWPEIPRQRKKEGWSYESNTFDIEIEKTATLDVLLHRLLESNLLLKKENRDWKSFSLKHNPQFYRTFPGKTADFDQYSIQAVSFESKVAKFKDELLHVIVDRESMGRQLTFGNPSKVTKMVVLPDRCGNGWQLDDDDVSIAVKLKVLPSAIVVWNTEKTFSDHLSYPSATTLSDEPVDSGSSLSREELDLAFGTDSSASQVTFPDQTVSIKSKEGFYPPAWDNPSDATLAPSVVMPTPRSAKIERNPGSSRHYDTYGSLPGLNHGLPSITTEHNSQVQIPVPIIYAKAPLGRITTSTELRRGLPSQSANIPFDSALDPPSVTSSPPNASSSRSPANSSSQVPAISAQGAMPSVVPNDPPEIRVDGIPTPTPPLGVGQTPNPNSRKKPAINVKPSLLKSSPTPSSPASFNPYFSPGSPSMRMVESDSPATPSGWGGWLKKKLQNIAGAPPK